jgi:hypothetical protein
VIISDQTIIQGHHWVKHHMVDQMSLLVDQFTFENLLIIPQILIQIRIEKLATSFGFQI